MEVINHQDGQELALALNHDFEPIALIKPVAHEENGHLPHQENGPVDNHGQNHVDNQEGGHFLNPGVAVLRRSYSIKEKRDIVQAVWTLVANGVSVRQACSMVGVPHQYYYHFKKAVKTADDLEKSAVFIHYKCNGGAQKLHPGHPSILAAIRDDLSQFVCETRE